MTDPTTDPLQPARAALLDHLPKDLILARYAAAGGQELVSGKFASLESSAALAANAFGVFADRPALLSLPTQILASCEVRAVDLEAQMRFPWSGGYHPWLDVAVRTDDVLLGIESKRYEPFRDRKVVAFSEAYWRPVWGGAMKAYEAMRDALVSGEGFEFLDAAQLVKHAFGLRTQALKSGRGAVLCYIYAEPRAFPGGRPIAAAAIAAHRNELQVFSNAIAAVESDVRFCSLSYGDLLAHWSQDSALADHAAAVAARFSL